jgi:hypothetical protein
MRIKLAIAALLLLVLTAVVGLSFSASAQTSYNIYAPLVLRNTCVGCDPRPTPTPRMWTHWGDQP